MHIVRIILSVIALGLASIGGAQATGLIHWNAAVVDLVSAGGGVFAAFGVTPIVLPPLAARVCAAVATLLTCVVMAHSTGGIPGAAGLFNALAAAGVLVGAMGRFQPPPTPPSPPPAG